VAAAVDPANCSPADELVSPLPDRARSRHGTEAAGGPSPRVTWVSRSRHRFLATNHLREGTVIGRVVDWRWAELWRGHVMPMLSRMHPFMLPRTCAIHCSVPRAVAFPAPMKGTAEPSSVVW
jgi:hypothetical protein